MKAWAVRNDSEWHALVYAETAAKARYVFIRWEPGDTYYLSGITSEDFASVKVRRVPQWDGLFPYGHVVETNAELPSHKPFYDDGWGQENLEG